MQDKMPSKTKKVILKNNELFFINFFPSATPNLISLLSSSSPIENKVDPLSKEVGIVEYFDNGFIRVTESPLIPSDPPTKIIYNSEQEQNVKDYFIRKYRQSILPQIDTQATNKEDYEEIKKQLISRIKGPDKMNLSRQYLHILKLNGKEVHASILGIKRDTFYTTHRGVLSKTFKVIRLNDSTSLSLKKQKKFIYIEDYKGISKNPIVNRLKKNIAITGMPLLENKLFEMCQIPSQGEPEKFILQNKVDLENQAHRGLDRIIQGIFVYEDEKESIIYYCPAGSKYMSLRKFGSESGSDLNKVLKEFKQQLMFELEESKHLPENEGPGELPTKEKVIRAQFGRIGVKDEFEPSIRKLESELHRHLQKGVFKIYSNDNFQQKLQKKVNALIQHFKELQTDFSEEEEDSLQTEGKEIAKQMLKESDLMLEELFREISFHFEFCDNLNVIYWLSLTNDEERYQTRKKIWVQRREDMKKFLISDGIERPEMLLFEKRNNLIIREIDREFFANEHLIWDIVRAITARLRKSFLENDLIDVFQNRSLEFRKMYENLPRKLNEFYLVLNEPKSEQYEIFLKLGDEIIMQQETQVIDQKPNPDWKILDKFEMKKKQEVQKNEEIELLNVEEEMWNPDFGENGIFAETEKSREKLEKEEKYRIMLESKIEEYCKKRDANQLDTEQEMIDDIKYGGNLERKEEESEGEFGDINNTELDNIFQEIEEQNDEELKQELQRLIIGKIGGLTFRKHGAREKYFI